MAGQFELYRMGFLPSRNFEIDANKAGRTVGLSSDCCCVYRQERMSGELHWYPISYDSGSGGNDLSEIKRTEIAAPDFPVPRQSSWSEGVDSLSFAESVVEVLRLSGRTPESIVWAVPHVDAIRGLASCFVFEQRQIYSVGFVSVEYETWLDRFDAETAERFASSGHPVPEFWFMEASLSNQRVTSVGGFPFESARNVERLDQYQRAQQFRTDLHGWLHAASPSLWHGQDDQAKKNALLDDAKGNAGSHVSIDEELLAVTVRRFLAERGLESREGANETEIAEFARVAGFELPSELQTVLRIVDGCYLASGYCDFLSTMAVTSQWKHQKDIFDASTFNSLTKYNRNPDSRTLPIDLTPHWIPITDHRSGRYLGIDLLPGTNGRPGQIISYDLGESGAGARVVVGSLLEFFEHELAGKIVNIGDPAVMILDDTDEWEDEEDDEETEIVEESWIDLKLWEQHML